MPSSRRCKLTSTMNQESAGNNTAALQTHESQAYNIEPAHKQGSRAQYESKQCMAPFRAVRKPHNLDMNGAQTSQLTLLIHHTARKFHSCKSSP